MGMIGISPTQNFAALAVPWHLETEFLRGRADRRAKDQRLHPHTVAAVGAVSGQGAHERPPRMRRKVGSGACHAHLWQCGGGRRYLRAGKPRGDKDPALNGANGSLTLLSQSLTQESQTAPRDHAHRPAPHVRGAQAVWPARRTTPSSRAELGLATVAERLRRRPRVY